MKKTIAFILLATAFLNSCNTLVFETPMPTQAIVVQKPPLELLGVYLRQDSSNPVFRELIAVESPAPDQIVLYGYKEFDDAALAQQSTYVLRGDSLETTVQTTDEETGRPKDTIRRIFVHRTPTGYRVVSDEKYLLDFKKQQVTFSDDNEIKNTHFEVRKAGEMYYLNLQNLKEGLVGYHIISFKVNAKELTINFLSSFEDKDLEEMSQILSLKNIDGNHFTAHPTDAQFEAYEKFILKKKQEEIQVLKRLK